jgi:CO/xanthine dehydrogenase FAD-binding subunit
MLYHRPLSLAEALAIRAAGQAMVLAGGTDVYAESAARAGWGDMRGGDVVDISALPGLRGITEQADHWRIGALTTWSDLAATPLPPLFDGLRQAAREIGGPQIQNRGTLGGNICTASAAGDGAPNLLVLDASVELASLHGCRRVALAQFLTGNRRNQCRADEIITAISVPKRSPTARAAFLKLGTRRYLVISIVMVAAATDTAADGSIAAARVAVGACSAIPQRLAALEGALAGQRLAEAPALVAPAHLRQLAPIDDVRGSADYRRHAALVLVRDVLARLAQQAREEGA